MQVKCDQCSTEYAVEESRIPEAGLKGKCTQCGHVFPLRRTLQLDFNAVSKKLEKAAKSTKWKIRKAGGEELEFSDLGTLRRWIVDKKVHREDQISKTGDDWKPLGTIVELSKMFTSPEPLGPVSAAALKAKQRGDESQLVTMPAAPSPLSDAPAPLEVSSSDVLAAESEPPRDAEPIPSSSPSADSGSSKSMERGHPLTGLNLSGSSKQLSVREDLLSAQLPSPPAPSSAAARALLERDPKSPSPPPRVNISRESAPASTSVNLTAPNTITKESVRQADAARDPFSLRISDSLPGLQPAPLQAMMSPRADGGPGLPLPAAPTNFSFQGEAPPNTANAGGRGFMSGVVTAIALVGVAYFVYDRFVEPRLGDTGPRVERAFNTDEVMELLDRGATAYGRDTEEGRRVADQAYSRLLDLLPSGESRGTLARRAHLGRAKVALARAEYAQLDNLVATPYLERAASAIAAVESNGGSDGALLLARADLYRLKGAIGPARQALELAEVAGAQIAEVTYVRLTLDGARDPVTTLKGLETAPPTTKALPRFSYYRAVTLERAGKSSRARAAFEQILATYPGHVGAQRRLAAIGEGRDLGAKPDSSVSAKPDAALPASPQTASAPQDKPIPTKESIPATTAEKMATAPSTTPKAKIAGASVASVASTPPKSDKAQKKKAGITKQPSKKTKTQPKSRATQAGSKKAPSSVGYDGLMSTANRLLEHGRAREARAKFLAASRKRPSSPEPLANLGWCELEMRRTGKAISYFKKSLGRNPRYADALYGLGVAHERNKDTARARKAYQTYLAVNPRGSKVRMVKRRLDRLR